MAYKVGKELIRKTITDTQDKALKNLPQHILHGIYSLTSHGQLYLFSPNP